MTETFRIKFGIAIGTKIPLASLYNMETGEYTHEDSKEFTRVKSINYKKRTAKLDNGIVLSLPEDRFHIVGKEKGNNA